MENENETQPQREMGLFIAHDDALEWVGHINDINDVFPTLVQSDMARNAETFFYVVTQSPRNVHGPYPMMHYTFQQRAIIAFLECDMQFAEIKSNDNA